MNQNIEQKTNYAIRVMVFKNNKVLLGKNKNWYGTGNYGFPGGHLEYEESFKDCVKREITEECGINVKNIEFHSIVNILKDSNKKEDIPIHNISILFTADWKSGQPKILEPKKCESWQWYDINNLPKPLFKNCNLALKNYKSDIYCFDIDDIDKK